MLYMVSTPSPYTKEAIKVYFSGAVRTVKLYNDYNIVLQAWKGMLDSDGVVALPSTSAPATNTDDQFEDYSKI